MKRSMPSNLPPHPTKEETVRAALVEKVAKRKQRRILELFGTIDYDPPYNYKGERLRS
jgi:hypothetical protein